jgi:hypothetical protein
VLGHAGRLERGGLHVLTAEEKELFNCEWTPINANSEQSFSADGADNRGLEKGFQPLFRGGWVFSVE